MLITWEIKTQDAKSPYHKRQKDQCDSIYITDFCSADTVAKWKTDRGEDSQRSVGLTESLHL